jgi:hypothetical protein
MRREIEGSYKICDVFYTSRDIIWRNHSLLSLMLIEDDKQRLENKMRKQIARVIEALINRGMKQ